MQYSLRLSVHFARQSRVESGSWNKALALVGVLAATRRLLALAGLASIWLRSLRSLCTLSQQGPPPVWPSTAFFDRIRLLGIAREALDTVTVLADAGYLLTSHPQLRRVFQPSRRLSPTHLDQLASLSALLGSLVGIVETRAQRTRTWLRGRAIRRESLALETRLRGTDFWEGHEPTEEEVLQRSALSETLEVQQRQLLELRQQLRYADWDKVRLGSEAVFAGEYTPSSAVPPWSL